MALKKQDNDAVDTAFKEVNENVPGVVKSTAAKYGVQRAQKQKVAIALSKARKAGARISGPKLSKGGKTF